MLCLASEFLVYARTTNHKRKFGEICGGTEHYLLITPIDTTVCNYLFQQGNLRSLTV
jgi:hypothetical protein